VSLVIQVIQALRSQIEARIYIRIVVERDESKLCVRCGRNLPLPKLGFGAALVEGVEDFHSQYVNLSFILKKGRSSA
jgi:hypothetical protein